MVFRGGIEEATAAEVLSLSVDFCRRGCLLLRERDSVIHAPSRRRRAQRGWEEEERKRRG